MVIRVASFFPFQSTCYLNGHSFMEQELNRRKIGFRKNDNAFLAVDDAEQLQAAADRLRPEVIRKQLDYWTLILGPKFSKKERAAMNLSRFYAVHQIEYCRNFIFKRHFPIHKVFERSCELGLWRLTAHKISEIFGVRLTRKFRGKLSTVIDRIEHGHHVYRAYWKNGPGMTPEIIVEGVVTAIEILHLIVFFEAANNNGHSVPHSPNQGIRRTVRFRCGYEFSKTFQLAPSPFDIHTWQDKARSHAFQPRKEQHVSLPARALAHDPVPQFPLRHGPSKQRYSIG